MLVTNRKRFWSGMLLAASFLGVLLLLFSPVFDGKNGLEFADDTFNRLAKGSSYFIPNVSKDSAKAGGKYISVTIKLENPDDAVRTAGLFTAAGAKVDVTQSTLKIEGDLGVLLQNVLKDADEMFKNNGKSISERYGYDERKVMKDWWQALSSIAKMLKKEKSVEQAKMVDEVNKKAVEPAYNFYKIEAQKVSEHAILLITLLLFYVIYTIWWGYSIFYIFEGIGLTMRKSKTKKEV